MISINCDFCKKPINELAALMFGPPLGKFTTEVLTKKQHICKKCYKEICNISKLKAELFKWSCESCECYAGPENSEYKDSLADCKKEKCPVLKLLRI